MAGYLLASATPLLLLSMRVMVFHSLGAGRRLILDLALLLVSFPIGLWLVGWALNFPADAGDHSPGLGIALLPIAMLWAVCGLAWLARFAWFAIRRFESAR